MISNSEISTAVQFLGLNKFHVFPLKGKKPATKNGFYDANSNGEIIADWYSGPYEGCNIGIRTGSASKLLVLDVDQKPGEANGMVSLAELQKQIGPLPNTVIQKTGTGHHYFFRYDGDDIRCSQSKIGPALDIKSEGGYVVVAPSVHPDTNTPYALLDGHELTLDALAYAPEALLALARKANPKRDNVEELHNAATASHQIKAYGQTALAAECQNIRNSQCGQQEDTLNKAAFAIGQLIGSGSLEYHTAMTALLDAGIAMTNCDPRDPWRTAEIQKKVETSLRAGMNVPRTKQIEQAHDQDLDETIAELNRKHAVVMVGGKCLVLNERHSSNSNVPSVTFSSFPDFKNQYCTKTVKVGKTYQKLGHAWLEHHNRRFYDQVVFDPANSSNSSYNLWQGFSVRPVKGNCSLYLAHIRDIIASGDEELNEYILNFMADAVQNPATRPGVSLVLRGGPGTGKGVFIRHFGNLFGRHFVQINDPSTLLGKFNRILEDKIIVFADEAFWAGDKAAEGRLKGLVTEPTITIEMKGVDSYTVQNYVRLIVATNESWAVPAMSKERRFCVIDVSDARQQDRSYFSAIEQQMANGGSEALLHFLLNRDIDGVDVGKFPQTKALEDQKRLSLSLIDQWFMDCLERGYMDNRYEWHDPIPCSVAYLSFQEFCKTYGSKAFMNESTFGKTLKTLVPNLETTRQTVHSYGGHDHLPLNDRVNHYRLSPIADCRRYFEISKGIKLERTE